MATGRINETPIRATQARELAAANGQQVKIYLQSLIAWLDAQATQLGQPLSNLRVYTSVNGDRNEIDIFIDDARIG